MQHQNLKGALPFPQRKPAIWTAVSATPELKYQDSVPPPSPKHHEIVKNVMIFKAIINLEIFLFTF